MFLLDNNVSDAATHSYWFWYFPPSDFAADIPDCSDLSFITRLWHVLVPNRLDCPFRLLHLAMGFPYYDTFLYIQA